MKPLHTLLRSALLALLLLTLLLLSEQGHADPVIVDPELARQLEEAAPEQPLPVILTYAELPAREELTELLSLGLSIAPLRSLPVVGALATPAQVEALTARPGLVSIYYNRPLDYFLRESVQVIGAARVWEELGYRGEGVGVAILDTGVDGTHPDLTLGTEMVQNVKIAGLQYAAGQDLSALDLPLTYVEEVPNSDTSSGHGSHVAGIVGASGEASGGYYRGVAPAADLVGIGAGEGIEIFTALAGFDWAITNQERYNIRIINCSWGDIKPGFDPNDPVNLASRRAYEEGIAVVFAAGNSGATTDTLNTYSVAPWVIGVAAGDKNGQDVAFFSSRGIPGDDFYRPTLTAPGYLIVSDRASTGAAVSATTTPVDPFFIPPEHIPFYTTANGTSMAAPHVAGAIALMVEANSDLTPDLIKRVLVNTATPMAGYQAYAAGAGYLNVTEAVRTAERIRNIRAYRDPRTGRFEQVYDLTEQWEGSIPATLPGIAGEESHALQIPPGSLSLEVAVDWELAANDLNLYLYDPAGNLAAQSTVLQSLYGYANETAHVDNPVAGEWTVVVRGFLNGPQPYRATSNAVVLVHP